MLKIIALSDHNVRNTGGGVLFMGGRRYGEGEPLVLTNDPLERGCFRFICGEGGPLVKLNFQPKSKTRILTYIYKFNVMHNLNNINSLYIK
jgi:hypothetical protein